MATAPTGLRPAGVVLASIAWFGVLLQAYLSLKESVDVGAGIVVGLVVLLGFFTVTTNLLVCVVLTAPLVARNSRAGRWSTSPFVVGGVATSIAFVALSYHVLLRNIWNPTGAQLVADRLLHYVTPVSFIVFWAVYYRRGLLRWRDPPLWAVYPVVYFAYALLRGEVLGTYPYFFIDVATLGYLTSTRNALGLLVVFLVMGLAVVGLDKTGRSA